MNPCRSFHVGEYASVDFQKTTQIKNVQMLLDHDLKHKTGLFRPGVWYEAHTS